MNKHKFAIYVLSTPILDSHQTGRKDQTKKVVNQSRCDKGTPAAKVIEKNRRRILVGSESWTVTLQNIGGRNNDLVREVASLE